MNPFDYVNSINITKNDIMVDDLAEKDYNPFLTNRALSYFHDTVLFANEMNRSNFLDKKLQYHFLLNSIRKGKRFSKWNKPEEIEPISIIKEYYNYSNEKAQAVLPLLTAVDLSIMKSKLSKGGKKR